MSSRSVVLAASAAVLLLAPGAALAGHGKAGLWSATTTMTMEGVPPQTRVATYCMTAADVNANGPAGERNPSCTYQNARILGQTYSADMVCTGQFNAKGHITSTFNSETHYTTAISIETDGMTMTNNVEGKWLKADCAGAQH